MIKKYIFPKLEDASTFILNWNSIENLYMWCYRIIICCYLSCYSDIDECSEINNPCYEPSSCIPVPAPSVLGTLQTDKASCSPCPAGTEDGDTDHPGTICLEKNGCLPNECSRYDECMDVTQNLAGTVGELNANVYMLHIDLLCCP